MAACLAVLASVGSASAVGNEGVRASGKKHDLVINVYHEAVSPLSTIGSGLGTVRYFFIPIAVNGTAADGQYLSATLTTVAQGVPPTGKELRASNLVFVFGQEADQIVVGGVSLYAPAGATLAPGTRTIRPITGGSGRYEGAVGQAVSTNLGANGWTHVLQVYLP